MDCKIRVLVYTTISIDGGIDYRDRHIVLSSERDLYRLHYIRSVVDAIVVGANTILKDDPLLTVRLPNYSGRQPYRVVVDSKLKTNPNYRVYDTSIAPSILVTWNGNKGLNKIDEFLKRGVKVVFVSKTRSGDLDLRDALNKLCRDYGIYKVLVEGGGYLIGSFIEQRLVDKIIVSISPRILGLNKIDFINKTFEKTVLLELISIEYDRLTGEIIVTYKPIYS